jgi:hypothetical protein
VDSVFAPVDLARQARLLCAETELRRVQYESHLLFKR